MRVVEKESEVSRDISKEHSSFTIYHFFYQKKKKNKSASLDVHTSV